MIHVIINPAAGQETPVLATLNSVFHPAKIDWTVSVTLKPGDARLQAKRAVDDGADIVAVYGGDGTVAEAASGMIGCEVPLAILPGGTANVVAQELGIPQRLMAACELLRDGGARVREVDMGQVNDACFLLRVGLGVEARITKKADRELKNKLGFLAYLWSAAQSLAEVEQATYYLNIDGHEIEIDGLTCGVINSGNLGVANLQMAPDIRIDDGLLDVIIVRNGDFPALTELIGSILGLDSNGDVIANSNTQLSLPVDYGKAIQHWTGKEISVRADPPQAVQYDGELLDTEIVKCSVLPNSLSVLVPH